MSEPNEPALTARTSPTKVAGGAPASLGSIVFGVLALLFALGLTSVACGAMRSPEHGPIAWNAAILAGLLVFVASASSWIWYACATPGFGTLTAALGGMLLRLALPLAGGIVMTVRLPEFSAAGLIGLIVVHYFVALAVDVALMLSLENCRKRAREANGATSAKTIPQQQPAS